MRQTDIVSLLDDINDTIVLLDAEINRAILNQNTHEVLKVKIKNCLENMRSCLDYCAMDIYELIIYPSLLKKPKDPNVNFPYGKKEEDFTSSLARNYFKQLLKLSPNIYQLIESIQSYKSNNTWLSNLCKITNKNKHNKLTPQNRETPKILNIGGGNILKISEKACGEIIFKNCGLNDQKVKNLSISLSHGQVDVSENTEDIDIKVINGVDFMFTNTDINILEFLRQSHSQIVNFQLSLYEILSIRTL